MAKLLVTGGNGFIGAEVCRAAVAAGHEVIGMGRSGRPPLPEPWTDRVRWLQADVFRPDAWAACLEGCDALVHCIGIARERPARGVTFERFNGDAAVLAADVAERAGVEAFVYLSAAAKPPLLAEAYIAAKRRAEREVLGCGFRGVVLRPGFVYGPRRRISVPASVLMRVAARVPWLGAGARRARPLPVELVARAVLRAATEPGVRGIVELDAIEALGAAAGGR